MGSQQKGGWRRACWESLACHRQSRKGCCLYIALDATKGAPNRDTHAAACLAITPFQLCKHQTHGHAEPRGLNTHSMRARGLLP